jgi:UDP-glucose 4-epimerase
MKLNILVTGGAGFIGSHVADAYLAAGHRVTVLDWEASKKKVNVPRGADVAEFDINDPRVPELFERARFDVVNHHAAQMSVPVSIKDPILDATTNLLGTLRLLQACTATGVRKFIFASSGGTVYGATDRLPATEDLPFDATSPYGVSKIAAELYLRTWAVNHGLDWTALRYANVYGPRQDAHGESGVVAIFIERMLDGREVVINGDGEYLRDYVYVGDVARANLLALDRASRHALNVGTGVMTSVNELFRKVRAAVGSSMPERHGPPRPGDVRKSCLDVSRAARVLGWKPEVGLDEGLRLTVEWFRKRRRA